MTLILNEIHIIDGLGHTAIVSAADRLITYGGRRNSLRHKVFRIPFMEGTVSYFGLAAYPNPKRKDKWIFLSEIVPNIINQLHESADLETFAKAFREKVTELIPANLLQNNASGFHICGYNSKNLPELWYFSNITNMSAENGIYSGLLSSYGGLSEDFLRRDAKEKFSFDGENLASAKNGVQTYRNGDVRAHSGVWLSSDAIFNHLSKFSDFEKPTIQDLKKYERYVRFQFQFLSSIYEHWCKRPNIGKPIDIIVLQPKS